MLTVAVARSSDRNAIIIYCQICGTVIFSYNAGNSPESKTVYMFKSISPGGSTSQSLENVVWSRSPGGSTSS